MSSSVVPPSHHHRRRTKRSRPTRPTPFVSLYSYSSKKDFATFVLSSILIAAVTTIITSPVSSLSVVSAFAPHTFQVPPPFTTATTSSSYYYSSSRHHHRRGILPVLHAESTNGVDEDGSSYNDNDDWRAFRARLVRDGLPSLSTGDNNNNINNDNSVNSNPINKEEEDPSKTTSTNTNKDLASSSSYAHESGNLIEVGTILVSIPTTDLCQALEQQFWHRSVVIITEVSDDVVNGDEETLVPDEQLAQGAGRGRWGYRGLMLNRMTDLVFDGVTGEQQLQQKQQQQKQQTMQTGKVEEARLLNDDGGNNNDNNNWKIIRGGDLASLTSPDGTTEFKCLHSINDPVLRSMSTQIMENLYLTSLDCAQSWCTNNNNNKCSDFTTFGGFCSWRPGQLEIEMGEGRGEWVALSVDGESILNQLRCQDTVIQNEESLLSSSLAAGDGVGGDNSSEHPHRLLEAGTKMWCNFLNLIGRTESSATGRLPAGQLEFYDQMLSVWVEENLNLSVDDGDEDDNDDNDNDDDEKEERTTNNNNDSTNLIGPGTLVRATAHVPNDNLLYDQEFIRSLVLVLEETPEATVGIVLNHPLAASVECLEGVSPLPLRYGGPIDVQEWKYNGVEGIEGGGGGTVLDDDGDAEEEGDDDMYEGFLDYKNQPELYYRGDGDESEEGDSGDGSYYNDEAEDDDDDSPFIWLHRDTTLGSKVGGGSPLGTSGIFRIKETEVLEAIQSGILQQEDTMVFSGVCIWEKDPELGRIGGGLREQIDTLQTLEVVQGCGDERGGEKSVMYSVWDILSQRQDVLVKDSLTGNIDAVMDAWAACSSSSNKANAPTNSQSNSSREALSDAALRGWVGVNLLGDPLGTLVKVMKARY